MVLDILIGTMVNYTDNTIIVLPHSKVVEFKIIIALKYYC